MQARFDDLIRLRSALQQLPGFEPPPQAWQRIAQVIAEAPAAKVPATSAQAPRVVAALAVASLAALVVAAPFWLRGDPGAVGSPGAVAPAARAAPVDELIARSRQLEATLQALPKRPAVELAANAVAIDALQARIRWLDVQLGGGQEGTAGEERARELWSTRVQLLNSLVGVRYAEAVRAGYTANTLQGEI
jgi:hypothetical protein